MIRIKDKTKPVEIWANCLSGPSPVSVLKLTGMGGDEHIYTDLEASSEYNFYKIIFDASKLEDGEYEYIINGYERGIILIGDLTPNNVQPDMKQTYVAFDEQKYVAYD